MAYKVCYAPSTWSIFTLHIVWRPLTTKYLSRVWPLHYSQRSSVMVMALGMCIEALPCKIKCKWWPLKFSVKRKWTMSRDCNIYHCILNCLKLQCKVTLGPKNECLDAVPRSRLGLWSTHCTLYLITWNYPFDPQLCSSKKTVREAIVIANHDTVNFKIMDPYKQWCSIWQSLATLIFC